MSYSFHRQKEPTQGELILFDSVAAYEISYTKDDDVIKESLINSACIYFV